MRGKPAPEHPVWCRGGNIPAYAGKTGSVNVPSLFGWEHPRVCGENRIMICVGLRKPGTSPRMRGKRAPKNQPHAAKRNIPAYAGKTGNTTKITSRHQEHPRVCGENATDHGPPWIADGTSPRMRGKRSFTLLSSEGSRNIPAYAGKTSKGSFSPSAASEHPRVCGENNGGGYTKVRPGGTSPRMRGKQLRIHSAKKRARNIPAYAGKTTAPASTSRKLLEHPRVCGENAHAWVQ